DPLVKLVPAIVSVTPLVPVAAEAGMTPPVVLMVGPGTAVIVKTTRLEPAPPVPFCTLTNAVPVLAINAAGTRAVNCELLMNAVLSACGVPPATHCTVDALVKFDPLTPSWNAGPAATALDGVSPPGLTMVGPAAPEIVNGIVFDVRLPGLR